MVLMKMIMPNFFIIGAAKSGTSSLYRYLCQHPQIYMSPLKEPHFFSFEETMIYSQGPGERDLRNGVVSNIADYCALFQGAEKQIAIGEGSQTYLDSLSAPERIRYQVPEAKIIVMLRNPAERAFSSFKDLRRYGREPHADFLQALKEEENRIRQKWSSLYHYMKRQFTYEKLKRYFDTFDKYQIKVYIYDYWKNDNLGVLRDIFRFLGVDEAFSTDVSVKYNVGGVPKNETYHKFILKETLIKTLFKSLLPVTLRRRMKEKLIELNLERRPLPPDIRKKLLHLYREDILRVQELIQKDLSHWLV